jgi:MYXO-CTERM domain-containing protein
MRIRNAWSGLLALGMLWVTGCEVRRSSSEPAARFIDDAPQVDLGTPEQVAVTLAFSNPERMMYVGTSWPLTLNTDARALDPSCPQFIDRSDSAAEIVDWRIQGDCTAVDESGVETRYEGRIVARGDASGTVIRYDYFKSMGTEDCNGAPVEVGRKAVGEVQVPFAALLEELEPGTPQNPLPPLDGYGYHSGRYVMSILAETTELDQGCQPVTYGLAYDVRMDYQDQDQNGTSRDVVQMEGRAAGRTSGGAMGEPGPVGSWELSAVDYTMASYVCASEPLSGALTVKSGGHEATVRPDGATSCDQPNRPCAPWSLDGQEQAQQICNYTGCSAGPDAPPPWIALAILLAGLLRQRRHVRRRVSRRAPI